MCGALCWLTDHRDEADIVPPHKRQEAQSNVIGPVREGSPGGWGHGDPSLTWGVGARGRLFTILLAGQAHQVEVSALAEGTAGAKA